MKRTLTRVAVALVVVAAGSVPAVTHAAGESAQHANASARAALVRYDPRNANNPVVETIGPTLVETSTLGLQPRAGANSYAWAASEETAPLNARNAHGAVAEQKAGPDDNATPVRAELPSGGAAEARARAFTLGVCPEPDAGGARVLSDASTTMASADGALTGTSRSTLSLVPAGPALAVRATAEAAVTSLRIGDMFEARVIGTPRLEARATGRPGGASFSYAAPVVDIMDRSTGESIARLDAADASVDLTPNDRSFMGFGDPIVNVRLGAPHNTILTNDGGFARAQVDVLEIRSTSGFEFAHMRIGSLAATAGAPADGITMCDTGPATVAATRVPHVLVYERASGWEHTSITQASETIAKIANETGAFTVEFTGDPSFLREDKLAGIDAVYFNSTTGVFPWTDAQKALFTRWVECGGGTIGTHAAADANHGTWPFWQELIGGEFEAHPHFGYDETFGQTTIVVEDQTSPITEPWHGMQTFRWSDEYYKWKGDPRGQQDITVLLSLDESTVYPWIQFGFPIPTFGGKYVHHQPLAWTKTYRGTGRVFYTAFGHNGFAWDHAEFRTHVTRGVEWVTQVRPDGCFD